MSVRFCSILGDMVERGFGKIRWMGWAFIAHLLVACGGAPMPQAQLTSAESAVRAAEVAGAPDIPKGKLHLKYARDQITEARALMEEKKNEEAERVLMRAEIDARYAHALAEHEEATQEAQEVLDQIEELTQGVGK